jgi:hypothetical protein
MFIFIQTMEVPHTKLVPGKQYYVQTNKRYIGDFCGFVDAKHYGKTYCGFMNVKNITAKNTSNYYTFNTTDLYYDLESIKMNSQKAKYNMEQRALKKILKRLVNEEFQWI